MESELPSFPEVTHVLLYFTTREQAVTGERPTGAVLIAKGKTVVAEAQRGTKKCIQISTPGVGADRTYWYKPEGSVIAWLTVLSTLDAAAADAAAADIEDELAAATVPDDIARRKSEQETATTPFTAGM